VKISAIALAAALVAAVGATPALAAAPTLDVPIASSAPSMDPRADETSFDPAAFAQLSYTNAGAHASQTTDAHVSTDGKFLYVRFDAMQTQKVSTGDSVGVELWPSGSGGSMYRFAASPVGTKDANAAATAATPSWDASGTTFDGGYTVTMKIPLAGLHGVSGTGPWNVQFVRSIGQDGQQLVWSHDGASAPIDDVAQAGTMTLPAAVSKN
jgi:hypothetical protein